MGIFDFFKRSYREQVVLEYTIQKTATLQLALQSALRRILIIPREAFRI